MVESRFMLEVRAIDRKLIESVQLGFEGKVDFPWIFASCAFEDKHTMEDSRAVLVSRQCSDSDSGCMYSQMDKACLPPAMANHPLDLR